MRSTRRGDAFAALPSWTGRVSDAKKFLGGRENKQPDSKGQGRVEGDGGLAFVNLISLGSDRDYRRAAVRIKETPQNRQNERGCTASPTASGFEWHSHSSFTHF